jgi:hypothetical protein
MPFYYAAEGLGGFRYESKSILRKNLLTNIYSSSSILLLE